MRSARVAIYLQVVKRFGWTLGYGGYECPVFRAIALGGIEAWKAYLARVPSSETYQPP